MKKSRVIFYDDEPQMNRRLRDALEKEGYSIVVPSTKEEAFKEINQNGAEIVIHGSGGLKTHWETCDALFTQYPEFPSIHLWLGNHAEEKHGRMKGPYHLGHRPLASIKTFLEKVRRLIFIGRLHRENDALRKALGMIQHIDSLFDSADHQEVKHEAVAFFGGEFKAENAFFLMPGGFNYFLNDNYKVTPISSIEAGNTRRHSICSWMPSQPEDLSKILSEFSNRFPSGWELRKARTIVEKNGRSLCFIPIVGTVKNQILGHIMLVNPMLYGDPSLEKMLPHLLHVFGRHIEQLANLSFVKSLSYIDDLTDLYNQRYLRLVLDKEIARSARGKQPFSVLFMDIDHFKKVNDHRGHRTGSKVLVEVSKVLRENIRTLDYGFRYGGDEFILILVGSTSDQALVVAERIRKQIEATTFNIEGTEINVTMSIGIATFPEHAMTKEQIIELADQAMYCGKNKSRNIVYVAS